MKRDELINTIIASRIDKYQQKYQNLQILKSEKRDNKRNRKINLKNEKENEKRNIKEKKKKKMGRLSSAALQAVRPSSAIAGRYIAFGDITGLQPVR